MTLRLLFLNRVFFFVQIINTSTALKLIIIRCTGIFGGLKILNDWYDKQFLMTMLFHGLCAVGGGVGFTNL